MWGRCVDVQYVGVAREKRDKVYKWPTENGRREIERKAKMRALFMHPTPPTRMWFDLHYCLT